MPGGTCENEYVSSSNNAVTNDLVKDTPPHDGDYGTSPSSLQRSFADRKLHEL